MSLISSRHDYYSVDSILLDQSTVEATMTTSVFMLADQLAARGGASQQGASGSGDAASASVRARTRAATSSYSASPGDVDQGSDVKRGTTMPLPLWAAAALFDVGVCNVQAPRFYSPLLLDDFKTDPTLPSVPERMPYLLEVGGAVAPYLPSAEATRVGSAALRLFINRYLHVINVAHAKGHDIRTYRAKLGVLEQHRLDAALKDAQERRTWRSGSQLGGAVGGAS